MKTHPSADDPREEDHRQSGLLLSFAVSRPGHSRRCVTAGLRRQSRLRMERARPRAVRREQAHPAACRIRRPHRSEIRLHRPAVRRRAFSPHAASAARSRSRPHDLHGLSHFEIDGNWLDVGVLGKPNGHITLPDHRTLVVCVPLCRDGLVVYREVEPAASTATDVSITWHVAPPVIQAALWPWIFLFSRADLSFRALRPLPTGESSQRNNSWTSRRLAKLSR
jgi:hypothetical protein